MADLMFLEPDDQLFGPVPSWLAASQIVPPAVVSCVQVPLTRFAPLIIGVAPVPYAPKVIGLPALPELGTVNSSRQTSPLLSGYALISPRYENLICAKSKINIQVINNFLMESLL